MPISAAISNGDIIVTATWTKDSTTMTRLVGDAAAYFFSLGYGDHGTEESPRTFDDLSNQEKLNLLYNAFTRLGRDAADTWASTEAVRLAREAVVPHDF